MGELVERYRQIIDTNRQIQLGTLGGNDLTTAAQVNISNSIANKIFSEYKGAEYTYWKNLTGGDANAIYNRIMAGAA
jgi:DNA-binding protein Fis